MSTIMKVSDDIQQLTGDGIEYLVINNVVIAVFYDGNLSVEALPKGNDDITINLV